MNEQIKTPKGIKIIASLMFVIGLIIFVHSGCGLLCNEPTVVTPNKDSIVVDATNIKGEVPSILMSNIWIAHPGPGDRYINEKFFSENIPSVIHLTLHTLLPITTSFVDFQRKLRDYLTTEAASIIIENAKKYDSIIIVGFDPAPMPTWLSSRPGDTRLSVIGADWTIQQSSPPKDYEVWANVVKATLEFFIRERGVSARNMGFYVGHEPNRDWLGSEESLFRYYESAARAAKEISNEIKVGGIGPWDLTSAKLDCDFHGYSRPVKELCIKEGGWADPEREPLLKNFIEYVSKNNVPIDFVNWHCFQKLPAHKFMDEGEIVIQWLRDNRLDNVKLFPSDWTYWGGPYPADYLDTEESAAYIIPALYYMWKGGIHWHGHDFDVSWWQVEDEVSAKRKGSTFIGNWSIFTKEGDGIIKPVYNAFKLLSMTTGPEGEKIPQIIEIDFSTEGTVTAISTIKDNGIYLLLSNFIPKGGRLKTYILGTLERGMDFSEDEKKLIFKYRQEGVGADKGKRREIFLQCKDKLISELKDPKKIEALDFLAKVYMCPANKMDLNFLLDASRDLKYPENQRIAAMALNTLNAAKGPKNINIDFKNLPFDKKAVLTTYTIDSINSNAGSLNKRTEPEKTNTPCGIGGVVDKAVWDAKAEARREGVKAASEYLLSLGYPKKVVESLKDELKNFKEKKGRKEYIDELATKVSKRLSRPKEKVKKDLGKAFQRYTETCDAAYYNSIDKINNWKEVSIEGSKKTKVVDLINKRYALTLNMEPNSIWLVILSEKK